MTQACAENSIKACDRLNRYRFRFNGCQWNSTRTITQIAKQYNMKYGKKIVIDGEWSEKMDTQMEISFVPLSLRIFCFTLVAVTQWFDPIISCLHMADFRVFHVYLWRSSEDLLYLQYFEGHLQLRTVWLYLISQMTEKALQTFMVFDRVCQQSWSRGHGQHLGGSFGKRSRT